MPPLYFVLKIMFDRNEITIKPPLNFAAFFGSPLNFAAFFGRSSFIIVFFKINLKLMIPIKSKIMTFELLV